MKLFAARENPTCQLCQNSRQIQVASISIKVAAAHGVRGSCPAMSRAASLVPALPLATARWDFDGTRANRVQLQPVDRVDRARMG